ncbi:MAG: PRC-barrel domain-containing protein [Caldilineaceae bacterium]
MKFDKLTPKIVLLILLLLSVAACTPAPTTEVEAGSEVVAEKGLVEGEDTVVQSVVEEGPLVPGVVDANDSVIRASKLIDYDFRNTNGEVTGKIKNVLIDVSTGNILFLMVEYGGFLDLGDTQLAMPLSAFSWSVDNDLVLNIDEQQLRSFPSLGDDWPKLDDPLWDNEVNQFWQDAQVTSGISVNSDTSQVMYLSDLLDKEIGDIGFGEGDIHDVLINLTQSHARYIIADYGTEPFHDNLIAIPFSVLFGRMIEDQLHFNEQIDLAMLEAAPGLDRVRFDEADLFARDFDDEISNYWVGKGYDVESQIDS